VIWSRRLDKIGRQLKKTIREETAFLEMSLTKNISRKIISTYGISFYNAEYTNGKT